MRVEGSAAEVDAVDRVKLTDKAALYFVPLKTVEIWSFQLLLWGASLWGVWEYDWLQSLVMYFFYEVVFVRFFGGTPLQLLLGYSAQCIKSRKMLHTAVRALFVIVVEQGLCILPISLLVVAFWAARLRQDGYLPWETLCGFLWTSNEGALIRRRFYPILIMLLLTVGVIFLDVT